MPARKSPPDSSASPPKTPRKRPGPRPRLSREAIARAALEIGLESATVTAVAARLEADHSSLYRHVKSRAEILFIAIDLAVEEMDWRAPPGDWRVLLERLAEAMWGLYEAHPGLAAALREVEATPPSVLRGFSEAVARLQEEGFSLEDAALAVDTLVDGLTGCFVDWSRLNLPDQRGGKQIDVLARQWEAAAAEEGAHAAQIMTMVAVMRGDPRAWWLRRQALILAGIATLRR